MMMGGGSANWSGSIDYVATTIGAGMTEKSDVTTGLTANPNSEDIAKATSAAHVFISGNHSNTHGGVIMNNGKLVFGEQAYTEFAPQVKKTVTSDTPKEEHTFEFYLIHAGQIIDTAKITGEGSTRFRNIRHMVKGTYYYEIREVEGEAAGWTYDDTIWNLTVVVDEIRGEVLGVKSVTCAKLGDDESANSTAAEFENVYKAKVTINVEKKWVEADGTEATTNIPESITVKLLQNGKEPSDPLPKEVILNARNAWKGSFENLPWSDESGNPYVYTVEEVAAEGWALKSVGNDYKKNVTIFTNQREVGKLTITKAIVGGGDEAASKEYTFTVTGPNGYNETVTITGTGSETLENLVPGKYTVTEQSAGIDGYDLHVDGGGDVTVEANKTASTTVTNTYTQKLGSLEITKKVEVISYKHVDK